MLSLSAPEPIRQTSMCQGLTGWVWISHVALLCTATRGGMGAPGEGPNGKTHCQWKRTRKVRLMQQISWTVMVVTPVFLLDANMQVRSSIILLMVFIKYINSNHNWSPYIYIMLLHEFWKVNPCLSHILLFYVVQVCFCTFGPKATVLKICGHLLGFVPINPIV